MEVIMKIAILCDVTPCILVEEYQCFRGSCYIHHRDDRRSTILLTAGNCYHTTQHQIPEDGYLRQYRYNQLLFRHQLTKW
jgi:hypothetical protein